MSADSNNEVCVIEVIGELCIRKIGNNVDQWMVVCGNAVPFEQRAKLNALLSRPSDQHCHD
jgi:hypothetical protein